MVKQLMRGVLVAGVLFGLTACGSDDTETKEEATASQDESDATEATEASGGGGGGGSNPEVEAYCTSADELAAELKDLMADPMSGDMAAVSAAATELTQKAAGLISAHAEDATRINECTQKVTDAVAGG